MEKYQELEMEVVMLDNDDIVTTSPGEGGGGGTLGMDDDTDH